MNHVCMCVCVLCVCVCAHFTGFVAELLEKSFAEEMNFSECSCSRSTANEEKQ